MIECFTWHFVIFYLQIIINLAYREEDAEAAKAEEEEALAIQKSVFHNIKADNLGAHLFVSFELLLQFYQIHFLAQIIIKCVIFQVLVIIVADYLFYKFLESYVNE